jgi:amidase
MGVLPVGLCSSFRQTVWTVAPGTQAAMSLSSLLELSAVEQARLIRTRQVSSVELVRQTLERSHALNHRYNAFVSIFESAIAAARRKDNAQRRSSGEFPLFHGVPIGIKDLNIVRGRITRYGSRAVPRLLLPFDDSTVAPLRRAGFVIIGKLATSEFGTLPVTEPEIHPPTRNPWAPGHTAGGSSGGSAAAVASGMLAVAQGSDGAGSIRIPAAFCQLYGLKPARGRLRNQFGLPDRRILYTSGPLTRCVDDAAAMLDVMAGLTEGRPHWAPPPARPFRERSAYVRSLRIRFITTTSLVPTDPEILAGLERSLAVLSGLGHTVEEGVLPDSSLEEFLPLWQHLVAQVPLWRWHKTQPVTRWLGEAGRKLRTVDVIRRFDAIYARFSPVFATADVWVMPTVALPPPPIGAWAKLPPAAVFAAAARLGAFTAIINLTGLPAASIPMGQTAAGLPMGLQIVGGPFAEADVLALSWQFEEAMPWQTVARVPDSSPAI